MTRAPIVHGRFVPLGSLDWLEDIPTTARCLFCPAEVFHGTAREAADWNQQHRSRVHPGLRSVSVTERNRARKAVGW